jgi:hypothetical protein
MSTTDYGPFTQVAGAASALVALSSLLFLKVFGRARRWSWLVDSSPPFLVKTGPQGLALAIIALVYATINANNYLVFLYLAAGAGCATFVLIAVFDHLRRIYVIEIPDIAANGQPMLDKKGQPKSVKIVIGAEKRMTAQAQEDLAAARKEKPLSLKQFLSGYGASRTFDVAAAWSPGDLAWVSTRLTLSLAGIFLFGVITLDLAASAVAMKN